MRTGEIVRIPDERISRYQPTLVDEPSDLTDYFEIVTVAELFDAAGHPVPEGAILVRKTWTAIWERVRDGRATQESEERSAWFAYGPPEHDGLLPEFTFSDNAWKRMRYCVRDYLKILQVPIIDLSRLPALDAWDALPEVVKVVVK